jgi:uncharacterized protein (UPF0335 family)
MPSESEGTYDLYGSAATGAKKSEKKAKPATQDGIAADELIKYLERVERLSDEKQGLADDIKEVKAEIKGRGYDTATFNEMLRLRKMDKTEREEREALRDLYGHAIGVFE